MLCPSCGAERPANAPEGLCPRCVLRRAMESDGPSGPGTMLSTMARISLAEPDATEPGPDPIDSPEMPATPGDAAHLKLLGEIARGGMGAVLKGRDPDLSRDLAVKVLLEKYRDDPEFLRRFVEEAQIAGQLQHPGIVPVYRLGTLADRRPYFTMKLVKGRTLASLLDERDTPADDLPRFVGIFEQVCRTVAYAHSRGVIHRDLKPSNVMVGGFGEVQVVDWGLAKVLARGAEALRPEDPAEPGATVVATARSGPAGSDLSRAGSVIGTPAFMPPEQARGEVERVDARADVFALGAILCDILAGRPPYVGRSAAEVQRQAARGDTAEALAEFGAIIRLKPGHFPARNLLGYVLNLQGRHDEAVAELREAIRLRPGDPWVHGNLSLALADQGKLDEAVAEAREAIRLQPDGAAFHSALGNALSGQGKHDEAVAEYREAVRLRPDSAIFHISLGIVLSNQGKLDEAVAECREAVRLRPDVGDNHFSLGLFLSRQGKRDEAIAEYRESARLQPGDVDAHAELGYYLRLQGRWDEALAACRRAAQLAPAGSRVARWAAGQIPMIEDEARLAGRLPAILEDKDRPAGPAEARAFAAMCHATKRYACAARLWDQALAADPRLAEDLVAGHRYDAACSAARAGAGMGTDPQPDDRARARWRKKAIGWLRADLARRAEQARAGAAAQVQQQLRHWKADPDLAGIRDAAAVAALPPDEQPACRALWADVDALLRKVEARKP